MAEVLAEHWSAFCGKCNGCGESIYDPALDEDGRLAAHQAAALSAAGFGPVQEARAEALAEVAEDALAGLREFCPDEALAIGFMSGYAEAARDHADQVTT